MSSNSTILVDETPLNGQPYSLVLHVKPKSICSTYLNMRAQL